MNHYIWGLITDRVKLFNGRLAHIKNILSLLVTQHWVESVWIWIAH